MTQGKRIANSALFTIVLASMVVLADAAAARPQSGGSARERYASPSAASRHAPVVNSPAQPRASWPQVPSRNLPSWPQVSSSSLPSSPVVPRGYFPRSDAPVTQAPETRRDYRRIRADVRDSGNYAAPARAPTADQSAHAASAAGEMQQPRRDYRQFRPDTRDSGNYAAHAHARGGDQAAYAVSTAGELRQPIRDYRQVRADSRHASNDYAAPAYGRVVDQPVYATNAAGSGYGAVLNSIAPYVGTLLSDVFSTLFESANAAPTYETDPGYVE